jgi:hypothetical protein
MNNALAVVQNSLMEEWQLDKELGEYAARSGIGNMYESALKAHVARELGISSAAALNGVYIIEGKPSISPALAWALIVSHPQFDGYTEKRMTDATGAFYGWEITLKRKNGVQATRRFTMEDAQRITVGKSNQKLADKDNWKNYPENVCYWRAMGFTQDIVWPDVTLGMKRSDELGADISPDGNVIQAPANYVIEMPQTPPVPVPGEVIPQYGIDTARLIELASTEEIMAANGGQFPLTPEDVNRTVHGLVISGKITLEVQNEQSIPNPE